ncbi:MAG: lamin tail domain-containing protein [Akkermansiaceae bacterium]|jgi:hypothetical protein
MTALSLARISASFHFFILTLPLVAADFHPVSSITSSTSGTDLYSVANLIQGPGSGFSTTEPHSSLGGGSTHTWVTNAPNGGSGDYFSNGVANPVLVIDLGSDRTLSEISTWGYANTNTNGGQDFTLRFATNSEGSNGFGTSITYEPSFEAGFSADARDSHPFSQTVSARYLEFTFTDNWKNLQGGTPGGDRVGLGEIAFENAIPPIDPLLQIDPTFNLDLDGSVQTIELPVTNLGATKNLTLSTPVLGGSNASAFTLLSSPSSIPPNSSDPIQLSFNPTGVTGTVNATLAFTTNDTSQASVTVTLNGFIHDPRLSTASFFDLGSFPSDSGPQNGQLTLANTGGGQTLNLTNVSLSGPNAANFSIVSSPTNIAPLGQGMIVIQLDPMGTEGIFSAKLEIQSNDALNPVTIINLNALVGDAIPNSGVRINEFMAGNGSTLNDGDGNSSDWIEIYNAGPGTADLSGWFLTDSASSPQMWQFPAGTTLAQNGYLIVFASGQTTDTYLDAGGFLHTNFKLATEGEYLALVMPDGITVKSEFAPTFPTQFSDISYGTYAESGPAIDLIASSNAAVLLPTNGTLGLTWTFPSFTQNASWLTPGTGSGVGFDNGSDYDPEIDVDLQSTLFQNGSSAYIRLPFNLDDASSITGLKLKIHYDDGFYAYLNGTEIASRNAPANPTWNSSASSNINENTNLEEIDISAFTPFLQNGPNVLAIHGMNSAAGSSDFLIAAELNSTTAPTGPLLPGYLIDATPGAENTGGASNPGPEILAVQHSPTQPLETENLAVTATILPRLIAVGEVQLSYRIQYGATTTLTMTDDGTGNDALAGDSIFTATIPASAYGKEDLIRWFVTAKDAADAPSRAPAFLDQSGNNQSSEYFGTVSLDPAVSSNLPVFQWFSQNVSASHNRSGARASVFFLGRFYDNLYVRQRGGATNGSVSQKFNFNKSDSLFVNAEMSSVGEINMNGNGADSTYVRQPLGFDTHRLAGNEACLTYLWQMRVNGASDRIGVAIEQVDDDFLDRYDYDRDGDLYKFVQRSNLNPVFFDTITGIEKKTGDLSNIDSAVDLVAGLNLPTSEQRRQWVIDNLDLPQVINYLASRSIIQDADDLRKNFYMYFEAQGDCRWRIFPWDKDYTFGVVGDGGTFLPHPFFGDEEHKKQNANQWNILYDVIFEEPVTQRIYLRRLRTLMDELLQSSSTPVNERILETLASDLITPASPPLSSSLGSINSYLTSRRSVLFNNYPTLVPSTPPTNPAITIADVESNPASGNQDQEFIRLHNSENTEIDLSGWTVEGGVEFTFRAGTVIERNGDLYLTPDSKEFLTRATSPTGGEELLTAGPFSSHLSNFSEVLTLKDSSGSIVDSINTPNNPSPAQLHLVISELMYHPASPNNDAEYLELMNISDSVTLDLSGVHFTRGIDFTFAPGTTLAPEARILLVLNQLAFEAVHGPGHPIAGVFQNDSRLNNGSDRLKLEDASNSSILEFTYHDSAPWPTGPDGNGFSLVLINPTSSPAPDLASSWRESSLLGGNPGQPDSATFVGDPAGDPDYDGITSLLEFAFGTPTDLANPSPFQVSFDGASVKITTTLNQAADQLDITLESSLDLNQWEDATAALPLTSRINNGDGTASVTFESIPESLTVTQRHFFRLKVTVLP